MCLLLLQLPFITLCSIVIGFEIQSSAQLAISMFSWLQVVVKWATTSFPISMESTTPCSETTWFCNSTFVLNLALDSETWHFLECPSAW